MGRFQLEAAIQSAHALRRITGTTDWEAIALLYQGLVQVSPTTGALVGRAAAVAEARGPHAAWRLLNEIPAASVEQYQPYWACVARVLADLGRVSDSQAATDRAIGLSDDPAVRHFLIGQFLDPAGRTAVSSSPPSRVCSALAERRRKQDNGAVRNWRGVR